MTIGAANVTAFIGVDGPYLTDLDGDHEVDELTELNADSVGFHVTDLDVGIMLMLATDPAELGVYLAAKLSVHEFGLVGIDAGDHREPSGVLPHAFQWIGVVEPADDLDQDRPVHAVKFHLLYENLYRLVPIGCGMAMSVHNDY